MKTSALIPRSAIRLLITGAFAVSLTVQADPISGSFTAKVTKQEVLPVTSQAGDMLMLDESHGTNKSANFMDGAQIVNKEVVSLLQGSGPHQGYLVFTKGDGSVDIKWSGNVSTVMSKGQPQISFVGTWEQVKGTGKYQGIQGQGTYSGYYTSPTDYVANWVGQTSLPVASK